MTTAQELMAELLVRGLKRVDIARVIGRNSRLVTHVLRGDRPGANLVPTLQAALAELDTHTTATVEDLKAAAPEAARRVRKSGYTARTRRGRQVGKEGKWATAKAERRAARNGGKQLGRDVVKSAGQGHEHIVITVELSNNIDVEGASGKKAGRDVINHITSIKPDMGPGEFAQYAAENHGGNVVVAACQLLMDAGYISGEDSAAAVANEVMEIEIKTW